MKPRQRQLAFVLASLCVIGALAAVTIQSLRLERNELRSRAVAEHEASVRLVLWRMDSMLAPILAREAATPYYYYQPFFGSNRQAVNPGSRDLSTKASKSGPSDFAETLMPSPLLQSDSKLVNLYFQVDAKGVNSPQAPEGDDRKLAESNYISSYQLEMNRQRLEEFQTRWDTTRHAEAQADRQAPVQVAEQVATLQKSDEVGRYAGVEAEVAQNAAPPAPAPADANLRGNPDTAGGVQSQQLSNDYAQRAQVASSSKLTQLEAERTANQYRRPEPQGDDKPQATTEGSGSQTQTREGTRSAIPPAAAPGSTGTPPPAAPIAAPANTAALDTLATGTTRDASSAQLPAVELGAGSARDEPMTIVEPNAAEPMQGPLEPKWLAGSSEPTLVLVRQVATSGGPVTQGLWLNWPELRGALLELANDVFPTATIDPLPGGVANLPPEALNRCLATIPAELHVPEPSIPALRVMTPVRVALSLAWIVAIAAIAASGLALRSATELADRRGQFVSAVTHELRTPLTTFCLYSQMLADGMVRDADAQAQYHSTLHRESQRLTRIVESVLEYARLGKRKAHAKPEATSVAALLDASLPALRERCQSCGLELVDTREGDAGGAIRVDRATFDRILSNLVDNACKYAAGSDPARVELTAAVSASTLEVRVRDFGPGVPATEAKRIFDPFFRGSAHSDGATPGLGLGLALCKALAREMGGDLSLIQTTTGTGACFRLALPRNA